MLHCWDVSSALGFGELAFWAEERADEAANAGDWHGSAIELWLSLCFEHRRFRHYGITPGDGDAILVNQLCRQLRDQLDRISEAERRTIVEQIALSAPQAQLMRGTVISHRSGRLMSSDVPVVDNSKAKLVEQEPRAPLKA